MNRAHHKTSNMRSTRPRFARQAGVSLVELILALAITAMLLTATMVALDASFKAYAAAAEEASTQAQTRMVVQRLLTLVRTSTAHGPTDADYSTDASDHIIIVTNQGQKFTIGYHAVNKELWLSTGWAEDGAELEKVPLLDNVTDANFFLKRRRDNQGIWVLERATIDLTAEPSQDNSLSLEQGSGSPIRLIASTMPRRLD